MNYSKHSIRKRLSYIQSGRLRRRHRAGLILSAFVLGAFLLSAAVVISTGYGMFRGILAGTPAFSARSMEPTGYFSTVYNSEGEEVQKLIGTDANRIKTDYDEFPQHLIDAFVAIEDSRFWQHQGIDLRAIVRAINGVLTSSYSGGGSTITQQLIKNTVFGGGMESNRGDRLTRKIQEQYLALQLTKNVDRKTILTNYLNTINMGSNTLGVKAAALRYFNKDVSQLTLSECAVLAGITQNPSRYNPITSPRDNAARRQVILAEMYRQGYITAREQQEALEDDVYSRIQSVNSAEQAQNAKPYSYYTDELLDQVAEALKDKFGYTDTQAWNMLYTGGLKIYTAQDPDLQRIVDEEMNNPENYDAAKFSVEYRLTVRHADGSDDNYNENGLLRWYRTLDGQADFDGLFDSEQQARESAERYRASLLAEGDTVLGETLNLSPQPQASFVLIEQSTGLVRAISGGRGEKTASRTLNRATDTLRQPGSTFKVISTFAPALDSQGATLATVYDDAPYSVGGKTFHNWWGDRYMGYHSIRDAIVYSMNIIAVRCMADTVTPQVGVSCARRLGISTLTSSDMNLATALGGITNGVSNLELTNAFAAIANKGTYIKPRFFTRVLDKDGNVILDNEPESSQALKSSTAFLLTDAMSDAMKSNTMYAGTGSGIHSTGTAAALDHMSCAGKSGTTSNNVDVWFVGYTPYYTAGVWGGCDQNQPLKDNDISNGGTSYHKRIWKRIMDRIHADMPDPGFEKPDDIETALVCRKSGKLPVTGICENDPRGDATYIEYFAPGTVPQDLCDKHVSITVCGESGELPLPSCPRSGLTSKVIIAVPEEDAGATDDDAYGMPASCHVHGSGP